MKNLSYKSPLIAAIFFLISLSLFAETERAVFEFSNGNRVELFNDSTKGVILSWKHRGTSLGAPVGPVSSMITTNIPKGSFKDHLNRSVMSLGNYKKLEFTIIENTKGEFFIISSDLMVHKLNIRDLLKFFPRREQIVEGQKGNYVPLEIGYVTELGKVGILVPVAYGKANAKTDFYAAHLVFDKDGKTIWTFGEEALVKGLSGDRVEVVNAPSSLEGARKELGYFQQEVENMLEMDMLLRPTLLSELDESDFDEAKTIEQTQKGDGYFRLPERKKEELPVVRDKENKVIDESLADEFTTNLTEKVLQDDFLEGLFSTEAVRESNRALLSRSLLVYSEKAGEGKTTYVQALTRDIANGKLPGIDKDTIVISVDPMALTAGTEYVGSFERRLHSLLMLGNNPKVILFIDEVHTLFGAGTHKNNSIDAFERLLPYLESGALRIIGATTLVNFEEYFSGNEALAQRFYFQKHTPPTEEKLISGMERFVQKYQDGIRANIDKALLEYIFKLSERYDAIGGQPRKAINLLRQVLVEAAIDGLHESNLTKDYIDKVAEVAYKVSIGFRKDPKEIRAEVKKAHEYREERVIGFENLLLDLEDLDLQSSTGSLLAKNGPQGKFLFTGPKGLGKTYILSVYAKSRELPFTKLRMTEYNTPTGVEDLLRDIAKAVRANADAVILFDEIEKANSSVQNTLLSVLTDEYLVVPEKAARGRRTLVRIKISRATIGFSTNAGSDFIKGLADGQSKSRKSVGFGKASQDSSSSSVEKLLRDRDFLEQLKKAMVADGLSEYLIDRAQLVAVSPPESAEKFKKILAVNLIAVLQGHGEADSIDYVLNNEDEILDRLTEEFYRVNSSPRDAILELERAVRRGVTEFKLSGVKTKNVSKDKCEITGLLRF